MDLLYGHSLCFYFILTSLVYHSLVMYEIAKEEVIVSGNILLD